MVKVDGGSEGHQRGFVSQYGIALMYSLLHFDISVIVAAIVKTAHFGDPYPVP